MFVSPPTYIKFGENNNEGPYPEQRKIEIDREVEGNYIGILNRLKGIAILPITLMIYVFKGVVSIVRTDGTRSMYYGKNEYGENVNTDAAIDRAKKRELDE